MADDTTTTTTTDGAQASSTTSDTPAPFYEAFKTEGLKTNPSIQRYKDPEELASAYVNLEKRYGIEPERRLDLPKDPADKEGWAAVYKRLGAPDKPEDYGFKNAEGSSEADVALVGDFAKTAAELHVPKDQAAGLLQWFNTKVAEANKAQAEQFEAARATGEATLRKEWGDAYDFRSKEIGRLLAEHNDPELTEALNGKLGNYPGVARFLGKMLDKMAEPGSGNPGGGAPAGQDVVLTPAQRTAEARKLEAHPAFRDAKHPEHKAIVQKRSEMLRDSAKAA